MAEGLRDKIARALFEKDAKHRTEKQAEWAWQNLLSRGEETYWHEAADAVLAVLDDETEWEYSYVSNKTGNRWGSGSLMDAQLGSEALDAHVERRRRAGPWAEVPEGEEW